MRGSRRGLLRTQLAAALEAGDRVGAVEQELAADEALEARAADDRGELLVERAAEGDEGHRRLRNTPITLPRIWT